MNLSFTSATTTASSTFGTATPTTGFSFGSGDAKPLFGAPSTENKPAFNFTSPTTSAPAFGGFSFGAKTTAATSTLFSSPTSTSSNTAFGTKPLNFSGFTSPPNQTVGSPGFGQPAAQQPQAQNVSFGATQNQQPAASAFGTPATNTQATSGLFGSNTSSLLKPGGTGFGFQTPASGFSSVQQPSTVTTSTAPQTSQSSLSFGSTTTSSGQFAFGANTGFGFGQAATTAPTSTAPAASTPSSGFFPTSSQQQAPTATQPQQSMSFPPAQQPSQPALSFPPAQQAGLSFNTQSSAPPAFGSTSLSFGTANQNQPTQPVATQSTLSFSTSQPSFSTSQATPTLGLSQPSGLSFSKPATSTPTTNTLNFTSQPSTTQALSFGTPQTSANLNFGASANQNTSQATLSLSTASTAQSSLPQASLNFGTSTAQASSGLNFGTSTSLSFGTKASVTAATTSSALPTLSTSAASKPATSFAFPQASSSSTTTTTPSGISTLGQATTSSALPALSTATTTTAPAVPAEITSLTFAQLEENINKWTIELEEQEKTFINQATQINAWDRLLISNGEKIVELNDAVQTVKNEQLSLDHELDFIVAQQKELQELLGPLEKQLLESTNDRLRDPEREHMYNLAENLDTQLRQMSEDLKEVIEHLNETNRCQDNNDPIVQIGRILNAHMSSMQWIDTAIAQISTKLDQLKATHDTLRRDNESSFRLTY